MPPSIVTRRPRSALAAGAVAVALAACPAAAVAGEPAVAVTSGATGTQELVTFDTDRPGDVRSHGRVTGLVPTDTLVGLEYRRDTGVLYGLGATSRLYRIDLGTAAATAIGAGPFTPPLLGTAFGVDVTPVDGGVRVVTDADQNLRIDPTTGAVAAADTPLAFAAGDPGNGNPTVVAVAHAAGATAGTATLYGIDSTRETLVRVGGPNGTPSPTTGQLTTIGALGTGDVTTSTVGFDISGAGTAFASLTPPGTGRSRLATVNLTTGAATTVGTVNVDAALAGLAIAPAGTISVRPATVSVSERGGPATVTLVRTGGPGVVTVAYRTTDVSATAGADYTATAGTVTFGATETTKTFTVPVTNDTAAEGGESFVVLLDDAGAATLASPTAATVTIADDDNAEGLARAAAFTATQRGTLLKGVAEVVTCTEACRIGVRVRPDGSSKVIGFGEGRLTGPDATTVRATLTRAGQRAVAAYRTDSKLDVTVTVVGESGAVRVITNEANVLVPA